MASQAGDTHDRRPAPRLTEFAHGGGCGCKLSPGVLRDLLAGQLSGITDFPQLLVGNAQSDDAAVWALDDDRCMVATTDFFMPVVDDPHDFGMIAATNALSDIYAMGARPLMALAILGIPLGKIENEVVRQILAGGARACAAAGIPVAGGHSIDCAEPIYGLAVMGECRRENLKTNAGARDGDVLILTKPLGVGIYSAAIKRGTLAPDDHADLIATTTRLNAIGAELGGEVAVHAMTDVTGFGLVGHGLEMARASGLAVHIDAGAPALLPRAAEWARAGLVTGASARNIASCGDAVVFGDEVPDWQRALLADPQTSGGLLVAVAADRADDLRDQIVAGGFAEARIVGHCAAGAPRIHVSG